MNLSLSEYLSELGYKLRDNGREWSAAAVYRGGDNPTALSINKTTGVFYDFVTQTGGDFKRLVELTKNEKIQNFDSFINELGVQIDLQKSEKPKIMQEKTWSISELNKLLPHYKFYEDRGISKETLRFFKSGLAHSGSMVERYVFPIFNESGVIHGWSGRDMTGKKEAKWKHIGPKRNWLYPLFIYENCRGEKVFRTRNEIIEKGEVILVESIGDMIALWERGIRNVLVTFGLNLSSKLLSFSMNSAIKKIVIATNNDFDKEKNRGKIASLSMFIQLMSYVDFNKIIIALPSGGNDFGDIDDSGFNRWKQKVSKPNRPAIYNAVLEYFDQISSSSENRLTKTQVKAVESMRLFYTDFKESDL